MYPPWCSGWPKLIGGGLAGLSRGPGCGLSKSGRPHWREFQRLRRDCFNAAEWRCERCRKLGVEQIAEECHHRDHDRSNNRPENLEALCVSCHLAEHDPTEGAAAGPSLALSRAGARCRSTTEIVVY